MSKSLAKSPTAVLVHYEAACLALSKARSVDEVKLIRDRHDAIRAAARVAKNKQLEMDACEIRIRAERRLGEMMREQKETVGLNKGAMGTGSNQHQKKVRVLLEPAPITLAEVGIGKTLADRARKLAAVPEDEFEEEMSEWRDRVSEESKRVTTRLERKGEIQIHRTEHCSIPDSAIVSTGLSCPTCGQVWPEGRPIHG